MPTKGLYFWRRKDNRQSISTNCHVRWLQIKVIQFATITKIWMQPRLSRHMTLPGTLAACCNPSSGAGAVWMEIPLRGWVRTPATKNGDRLKVILPKSHYTRALRPESRKNTSLRSRSASATTNHSGLQLGAQGCGFDSHGRWSFSAILCFEFSQ